MAKNRSKADISSDPIEMLMHDHKEFQQLCKDFEKADQDDPETCRQIVETACNMLKVHAALEEEIFYPAIREQIEEDLVNEAEVEHQSAKDLIEKLEGMPADDPYYAATFTVLGEYVKHHVKEEEGEMFPQVKKAKMDLAALGEEMRERREELMSEIGSVGEGAEDEEAQAEGAEAERPEQRSSARHSRPARR